MSPIENTAMDFWFEFYYLFNFGSHRPPDISDAVNTLNEFSKSNHLFKTSQQDDTFNTEFRNKISKPALQDSIRTIADNHLRLLDKFFGNDARLEQSYFGQGSLFDNGVDRNGSPEDHLALKCI